MTRRVRRWWSSVPRSGQIAVATAFAFGLLLWARLIIFSDLPRTAIARPESAPAPVDTSDNDLNDEAVDAAVDEQEPLPANRVSK